MLPHRFVGLSDRVLVDSTVSVRWVGHYELDYHPSLDSIARFRPRERSLLVLRSGRGYHLVSLGLMDWNTKREWFQHWSYWFPSDYTIARDNVLRITEKRGENSAFEAFFKKRNANSQHEHISGFHLRAFAPRLPQGLRDYLYEQCPVVKTTGLYKAYYSDPNAVFERVLKQVDRFDRGD